MKSFFSSILLLVLLFPLMSQAGKKPQIGKPPSWVTIKTVDYNANQQDDEAEDGYVDLLFEKETSLAEQSVYYRKVIKILNETGIQNGSEISADFDPSYQQLIFHTIRIIRGNQIINQLNLSKIKTIQQEEELDMFSYNGSLSSILFLEDVRTGDIIEYSYTIKGFNPVFNGKYASVYDLNFNVPVYNLYYKLIVPQGREISFKNYNTSISPLINRSTAETVYEWKSYNVNSFHCEDGVPSWYDPYSSVGISEYKNWEEVNDWAMKLFPTVTDLSPLLQKKISELRNSSRSSEELIHATLKFVQDDIRYLGIEIGVNSHQPNHPNKIFAQRYGDCKDKAYLLCTMLRAFNIEANPVLVNTSFKKTVNDWLPSSHAFDHVTVRVSINGIEYWFDPTISYQRGPLSNISFPDFECGLVVREGTSALRLIPGREPGRVETKELFEIPNMSGKTYLKVTTEYSGSYADNIRSSFKSSSKYEMLKEFKEFYDDYFEKIVGDSLSYIDDERTGIFRTMEYYTIHDLWEIKDGKKKITFQSYLINSVIKKPSDEKRKMPFELTYPAKYIEDVEIDLPEEWESFESFDKIETKVFLMSAKFSCYGRKSRLHYEYENLKDHVMPEETDEFMKAIKKNEDNFGFIISKTGNSNLTIDDHQSNSQPVNSKLNFYLGIVVVLIVGGIVWEIYRRRNRGYRA